jgi:hypothetical protein
MDVHHVSLLYLTMYNLRLQTIQWCMQTVAAMTLTRKNMEITPTQASHS